jgi:predicted transcriptional regulator
LTVPPESVVVTDDGARLREVLAGRHRLLARLARAPADKPTLVDDLPVARSTVDRGVRDLEEVGCVERAGGELRASAAGRAALAAFERYADATDGVAAASPVLASLPADVCLPRALLVDAEVRVADDHVPEQVSAPVVRAVREADVVRATAPVVYGRYLDHTITAVENGADVETVVARPVVESARAFDPESIDELNASERYAAFVTDRDLPYAVTYVERDGDETVAVTVYENGAPRGVLVNDTAEAVAWGRERYRVARAGSERLHPDGAGATGEAAN